MVLGPLMRDHERSEREDKVMKYAVQKAVVRMNVDTMDSGAHSVTLLLALEAADLGDVVALNEMVHKLVAAAEMTEHDHRGAMEERNDVIRDLENKLEDLSFER